MLRHRFSILCAIAFLAGCDDPASPPAGDDEIASVHISAADSVVAIGEMLAYEVVTLNAKGEPVSAFLHLGSGDPSVAEVLGGAIAGRAAGYADIHASTGQVMDRLRVRVYDPTVPLGTVRTRLGTGDGARVADLSTALRIDDVMGDGPGDAVGFAAFSAQADTSFTLILPGSVQDGRRPFVPYPLDGGRPEGVVALLRIRTPASGDVAYYASVAAGFVELAIDEPPAPGWRTGSATGFAHVPLVRLLPGVGGPPTLSTDTLLLHADLHLRVQHVLRGYARVTVVGGPLAGTSLSAQAFAATDDHGGWLAAWDVDFDGAGSGLGRWELNQELRVLDPVVGAHEFPRFTGPQFGEPALWPVRFSSIFYRDDPRIALVTDGEVEITRWLAPALEDYGVLEGTIDARYELWSPDLTTPTGDTVSARAEFAVPIPPLVGMPAAPPSVGGL